MAQKMDVKPVLSFMTMLALAGVVLLIFYGVAGYLSSAGVNVTDYFAPIQQGWQRSSMLLGVAVLVVFVAIAIGVMISKIRGYGIEIKLG